MAAPKFKVEKKQEEVNAIPRIEIFRILKATTQIIEKPQIKSSLTGTQIYWMAKLKARAEAINKRTSERETEIRRALSIGIREVKTEPERAKLREQMNDDITALFNETVELHIATANRIPFANAEGMMQFIEGDEAAAAIEYLIEAPKEEAEAK